MVSVSICIIENMEEVRYYQIWVKKGESLRCIIGKCEYNQDFYRKCCLISLYDSQYHEMTFRTYKCLLKGFVPITNFPISDLDNRSELQMNLYFMEGENATK